MSNVNFFGAEYSMSLGKQKNLIIFGAVVAALLAGSVLVAGYANILPGRAKADEQVKACPLGGAAVTCAAKAETAGFAQVVAATQADLPQACCGAVKPAGACCNPGADCDSCEKPARYCGEPCPPGCPKPCCPLGAPKVCCGQPKPADVAGGCCAAGGDGATE